MKTKFTATFKNGDVVIRASAKPYTHAWQVYAPDGKVIGGGFTQSESIAFERAAAYERKCLRNNVEVSSRGYEIVECFVKSNP